MNTASRLGLLFALSAALVSCTALKVVTHDVNDDPVKAPAGAYRLDPHHWSIAFDVDHFGYSRFVSRFDKAEATLEAVPATPEKSRVDVTIKAASIDTNDPELDAMLKGADLFDAAKYPDIRFVSTSVKRTGKNTGEMTGDLTIHGATHPVTLAVVFNGAAPDPLTGDDTIGFSATGAFDRSQWGLSAWWPAVGNDVHVRIEAEFVKPAK
jgi:polyisoprenoid-binding protein YceI